MILPWTFGQILSQWMNNMYKYLYVIIMVPLHCIIYLFWTKIFGCKEQLKLIPYTLEWGYIIYWILYILQFTIRAPPPLSWWCFQYRQFCSNQQPTPTIGLKSNHQHSYLSVVIIMSATWHLSGTPSLINQT